MVVTRERDGLHYRGSVVPEVGSLVGIANAVAVAGWSEDDRFLDLEGDPSTWIKIVRSGSRRIAFGSRLLFDTPELSLEDGVDEAMVAETVRLAIDSSVQAPHVLYSSSGPVLLDGTKGNWILRNGVAERWSEGPPMVIDSLVLDFAERIRVELSGDTVELVELVRGNGSSSDVEVIVERGNWEFIVPAVVAQHSEIIGVPSGSIVEGTTDVDLPVDFEEVGSSRFEDAIVAVHTPTSYRVLVRHLTTG
jgi:hypothetical protein